MRIGNKEELNCKRHCKLNRREVPVAEKSVFQFTTQLTCWDLPPIQVRFLSGILPATDDHPRWHEGQKYVERPA